jgi:hypothetical protein
MEAERRTHKTHLDPKRDAAGWPAVPFPGTRPLHRSVAVEECPSDPADPAHYARAHRGLLLDVDRSFQAVLAKVFRGELTGAV